MIINAMDLERILADPERTELPPGECLRCKEFKRIIPAWWLRDEEGVPHGGLCSDCCIFHNEEAETKRRGKRR